MTVYYSVTNFVVQLDLYTSSQPYNMAESVDSRRSRDMGRSGNRERVDHVDEYGYDKTHGKSKGR